MGMQDQKFESEKEWINRAHLWLTGHENYDGKVFRAVCFDCTGKICKIGADFMSATYPVYWVWPDQNLFNMIDSIDRKQSDVF